MAALKLWGAILLGMIVIMGAFIRIDTSFDLQRIVFWEEIEWKRLGGVVLMLALVLWFSKSNRRIITKKKLIESNYGAEKLAQKLWYAHLVYPVVSIGWTYGAWSSLSFDKLLQDSPWGIPGEYLIDAEWNKYNIQESKVGDLYGDNSDAKDIKVYLLTNSWEIFTFDQIKDAVLKTCKKQRFLSAHYDQLGEIERAKNIDWLAKIIEKGKY